MQNVQPLSLGWIAIVGAALVPLLTGFLTKLKASRLERSIMTFVLAAAVGGAQTVQASTHVGVSTRQLVTTGIATWILAIVAHYGLWEPTGLTQLVQSLAPNFGIGTPTTDPPDLSLQSYSDQELLAIQNHVAGVNDVLPADFPVTTPSTGPAGLVDAETPVPDAHPVA